MVRFRSVASPATVTLTMREARLPSIVMPTVGEPTIVSALSIRKSVPVSVTVCPAMAAAKSITSPLAASAIACRSEPGPASFVLVTVSTVPVTSLRADGVSAGSLGSGARSQPAAISSASTEMVRIVNGSPGEEECEREAALLPPPEELHRFGRRRRLEPLVGVRRHHGRRRRSRLESTARRRGATLQYVVPTQ